MLQSCVPLHKYAIVSFFFQWGMYLIDDNPSCGQHERMQPKLFALFTTKTFVSAKGMIIFKMA